MFASLPDAEFEPRLCLPYQDNHINMDNSLIAQYEAARRQCLVRFTALLISIIVTFTSSIIHKIFTLAPGTRQPYHTSILTGEGWMLELLFGHPQRIQDCLGVSHHTFSELITVLRSMGLRNSRYVSLEEQLAIFLYACVTGVSIVHVAERFQRSKATISR